MLPWQAVRLFDCDQERLRIRLAETCGQHPEAFAAPLLNDGPSTPEIGLASLPPTRFRFFGVIHVFKLTLCRTEQTDSCILEFSRRKGPERLGFIGGLIFRDEQPRKSGIGGAPELPIRAKPIRGYRTLR